MMLFVKNVQRTIKIFLKSTINWIYIHNKLNDRLRWLQTPTLLQHPHPQTDWKAFQLAFDWNAFLLLRIFTARKWSLGQGNVLTGIRLSTREGLYDVTSYLAWGRSLSRGVSLRPPYGKERAVCILLECILVSHMSGNWTYLQYGYTHSASG